MNASRHQKQSSATPPPNSKAMPSWAKIVFPILLFTIFATMLATFVLMFFIPNIAWYLGIIAAVLIDITFIILIITTAIFFLPWQLVTVPIGLVMLIVLITTTVLFFPLAIITIPLTIIIAMITAGGPLAFAAIWLTLKLISTIIGLIGYAIEGYSITPGRLFIATYGGPAYMAKGTVYLIDKIIGLK